MKRRYGVVQGLVLSLFSPAYYRDVARNWGGIGFVYLLLLFFLTWVPVLAKWQIDFERYVQNDFPDMVKDLPKITIQGGKVSSPVEQPFTINDPQTGQPVFVLDTTGVIDSLEKTPAKLLLTETRLHTREDHRTQVYELRDFPDLELSKEKLQEWLSSAGNWLGVACFPFVMLGSLIRALFVMLLAGVIGLVFRSMVNPDITYGTLLRLGAMGITWPTYIATAAELSRNPIPYWFWITVALTAVMVVLGAKAAESGPPPIPFDDDTEPPQRPFSAGGSDSDTFQARP
jgi:hypothetical protein